MSHGTDIDIDDLVLDDLKKLPCEFDSKCIRKYSNWPSNSKQTNFIDNVDNIDDGTNMTVYAKGIELRKKNKTESFYANISPKIDTLLKNIRKLDEKDLKETGKLYKHFIFTDLKSSAYGAKMIGSALVCNGYKLAYDATQYPPNSKSKKKFHKIHLLDEEVLKKTKSYNFYILSSTTIFDQSISVELKKQMLSNFNSRPDNVYGENVRFIIMDSGYKEGIDLFDIKYVHIFEPQTTMADQRQVIGRGTRTCGQKGLDFHPTHGWVLDVFIYDLSIPTSLIDYFNNSETVFHLYLESLKRDKRLFALTTEIEDTAIESSVDYELNKPIHEFNQPHMSQREKNIQQHTLYDDMPPRVHFDCKDMHKYINEHFGNCMWDTPKMENGCVEQNKNNDIKPKKNASLINYTPTQKFISHYFSPELFAKGMLLWHSVGTGKTCSAIASVSNEFERQGYTILWVTRTTLKSDIWKNIFSQVCHAKLRELLVENPNFDIPKDPKKQFELLSKSWRIRPISYKQFSNLVSKKNIYYERLVKLNGEADPLRKTVIVIDEAHKLYGVSDLSTIEKPDMNKFHEALMNSYTISGNESAKVLLMTATPITENPLELVKLINLCKPLDMQMPSEINLFASKYLDENGYFTTAGKKKFKDDMSGYISYLNRERDARTFSQPIIHYLNTDIANEDQMLELDRNVIMHQYKLQMEKYKAEIEKMEKESKIYGNQKQKNIKGLDCPSNYTKKLLTKCKKLQRETKKILVQNIKEKREPFKQKIKETRGLIKMLKDIKTSRLSKRINILEERNMTDIDKNTVYYKLSRKCRLKPNLKQKLQLYINNDSQINRIDHQIRIHQEMERNIKNQLKDYSKSRINTRKMPKKLQMELKDPLELERHKNNMKILREQLTDKIDKLKENDKQNKIKLKEYNKTRRKVLSKLIPNIRKTLKKREKEILKNIMENEEIKNMVNDSMKEFQTKLKELEENHEKEEKAIEEEKAAIKKAKEESKEAEKQAKLAAKEAEKQAKLAAKEAAKKEKNKN